jgi:hypothetical protein
MNGPFDHLATSHRRAFWLLRPSPRCLATSGSCCPYPVRGTAVMAKPHAHVQPLADKENLSWGPALGKPQKPKRKSQQGAWGKHSRAGGATPLQQRAGLSSSRETNWQQSPSFGALSGTDSKTSQPAGVPDQPHDDSGDQSMSARHNGHDGTKNHRNNNQRRRPATGHGTKRHGNRRRQGNSNHKHARHQHHYQWSAWQQQMPAVESWAGEMVASAGIGGSVPTTPAALQMQQQQQLLLLQGVGGANASSHASATPGTQLAMNIAHMVRGVR